MHKVQNPDMIIEYYNDGGKTVTMYAHPATEPQGIVEQARIESEWANARLTFTAEEFKAAPNAAQFLEAKAADCALKAPKGSGLAFDYSESLALIIERCQK
jgi:hypothetical protein